MMTVKECYESMESDYEGVMGRMGSEEMVKRFALKFLDDPSYSKGYTGAERGRSFSRSAYTKGTLSESGL